MERAQQSGVIPKGFKSVPKIIRVQPQAARKLSLLFSNGSYRLVDIEDLLLNKFKIKPGHFAYSVITSDDTFKSVVISGDSISWPSVTRTSRNFSGEMAETAFDLDPIVLYNNSIADPAKTLGIGAMVKSERKKAGLTQEELAKRVGTNKQYISRLENDKSDLEIQTLRKVVEGGLGKKLEISIV